MISIIEKVFAATNSPIKYGIGFTFVCLQKKQIKGVKVRITISLDVNVVRIAATRYILIKIEICLLCANFTAFIAAHLNNPISSKNIDKKVMDKNNTKIFIGLIALFAVKLLKTSLIGTLPQASKRTAPTNAIIQYVPIFVFLILKDGKNIMDINNTTKTNIEITSVRTITLSLFLKS